MNLPSSEEMPVARAIQLSLNASRWEHSAQSTADPDERFSRRIQAEICRLMSAATLRDIGG